MGGGLEAHHRGKNYTDWTDRPRFAVIALFSALQLQCGCQFGDWTHRCFFFSIPPSATLHILKELKGRREGGGQMGSGIASRGECVNLHVQVHTNAHTRAQEPPGNKSSTTLWLPSRTFEPNRKLQWGRWWWGGIHLRRHCADELFFDKWLTLFKF